MIQTIRIGLLLREAVATPYRNLVTRPTGAAVRGRIEEALAESGCLTALLDFSDIELLDFSCADEVVAKLLLAGSPTRRVRGARAVSGKINTRRSSTCSTHHGLAWPRCRRSRGARLLGGVRADARRGLRLHLRPRPAAPRASWPDAGLDRAARPQALQASGRSSPGPLRAANSTTLALTA